MILGTKIISAFFLITFLSSSVNFSQIINFKNITSKDGLSNNKVVSALQDRSGFIWFGTEDGLNRFDGYEFKIFRNDPTDSNSISSNNIWSLFEDNKGNIWIGTKSGELNRYDPLTENFRHWEIKSKDYKENSINEIYRDKEGVLWLGTYQSGLYRFDIKANKIDNWAYKPNDPTCLSNNFVTSITEDNDGFLWIGTYNGLNKFNPKANKNTFLKFFSNPQNKNTISNNLVWRLNKSAYDSDLIWTGTADGLTALDTKQNTFSRIPIESHKDLQFGNSIASVIEENVNDQKILWLASYGGLIRMNLDEGKAQRFIKNSKDPSSIVSNEINALIRDRSGVLWLITENGLSFISNKSMKFKSILTEYKNNSRFINKLNINVKSIVEGSDGELFFGTSNGVYRYQKLKGEKGFEHFEITDGINIWSLATAKDNELWMGTYGKGLKKLNTKNNELKNLKIQSPTFKTSAYDYIKSLFLEDNKFLWMGFWGGGLGRLDISTGEYKIWITESGNINSISHNDVWAILKDRKGRLWIGTNGSGLNLFEDNDGGKFHRWNAIKNDSLQLSSNSIFSLCEEQRNRSIEEQGKTILWIGTSNGLNKLTIADSNNQYDLTSMDVQVKIYTTQDGLSDNAIKSILQDDNGNLWLGTNSGISCFNIEKEEFINYSNADGIIGNEFNSAAAYVSNNGLMYFGSVDGLNVFNPTQIKLSSYLPPIVITDFQIFNQPVKIGEDSPLNKSILNTDQIVLSYFQNVFSFQFAALDYNSPSSIQYGYKMEGFDDDWINSDRRRFITYTNLNSGEYKFKVKSTNSDGVWCENIKSISIIIKPPWWRTGWAYSSYILIIIVGLYIARRIENNRSSLRNELKMKEFEAKKQRELENMKTRFFANLSHEFRTPLTLIQGPVDELISGTSKENQQEYFGLIKRNSEKLQELIDQLLELTQLENAAIPLNAQEENLIPLLRGMFYSFESLSKSKDISLKFWSRTENMICSVDRDKLEKIINNLLSNAFKFTPNNGEISVMVDQESNGDDKYSVIKIRDTGIGIPEDKLENIFDRFYQVDDSSLKKYGGSGIGLALVKELVDLHKWKIIVKSEIGKGTEFILRIPLLDNYSKDIKKQKNQIDERELHKEFTSVSGKAVIENLENEIEKEILEKEKLLDEMSSILIVEDSEDVRIFLKGLLQNEYRTNEAVNGEDGLKKAANVLPALIISDVMMPSMDGIEFCRRVKTDLQTSHIPVILLTAKASQESKLEGLETGADAYLTKPFSSKELLVRIKNLLQQRKNLHDKFSKEIKVEPSSLAENSLDNEFLQRAFDTAQKNLSNTTFSSEAFAKEMFLSRSQFHRKLLAITGQAPGEFLRTYRLKRAATFILEKRLSITQIAFEVGFSSPSHFTKAFRQKFNCLPTEFIERNNS